jgi:phosphoribosylaminoimidazole (AIR) synthetase
LYKWLLSCGIKQSELLKTFNAGYGMVLIADGRDLDEINKIVKKYKFSSSLLGNITLKKNISDKSVALIGKLNK